jgi:hypothetical protein
MRIEMPGRIWLPLPTGSGWLNVLRDRMAEHRGRWPILPAAFDSPLSLDIAVDGQGEVVKDIDNAAHAVLAAFEGSTVPDIEAAAPIRRLRKRGVSSSV